MRRVLASVGSHGAAVLCIALLFAAGLPAQQSAAGPIQHVLIISVDGMLPETYVNPDAHGLKVPTLREIMRQGSYSEGVLGVFPTVTYPSHTSIVTGTNPGTHGIVTNAPWDPLGQLHEAWRWYAEDIRVPTLWDVARAKGLKTAVVFWPVTVGARATAIVPEFWRQVPGTPEDAKLNWAISTPGLLEAVARRFPDFRAKFVPPQAQDEALTDVAVHLIETLQPNLLLLHTFEVDHWQHEDGPFTGRALTALETADQQIARLIAAAQKAGIWEQTVLVVVSDHGHARTRQQVRPGVLLREKGLITLDGKQHITAWKAWVLVSGGTAFIYVKEKDDQQSRRILLETFQRLATKPRSSIARIFTHEQIVAHGGDPEAFLALEAADGWLFAKGYTGDLVSPATIASEHGYSPERSAMRASLLIYGPAIGHGKIAGARLIDVAPTVAGWLALELDKAEGRPLKIPMRYAEAAQNAACVAVH